MMAATKHTAPIALASVAARTRPGRVSLHDARMLHATTISMPPKPGDSDHAPAITMPAPRIMAVRRGIHPARYAVNTIARLATRYAQYMLGFRKRPMARG